MAEEQERTEQATPQRRQKARDEGQFARSRELTSLAAMAGALLAFVYTGSGLMDGMRTLAFEYLGARSFAGPVEAVRHAATETMRMVMPFFLGASALSVLAAAAQQGGFSFHMPKAELSRMNPLKGVRRLLSGEALVEAVKTTVKFTIVGYVLYRILAHAVPGLSQAAALDVGPLLNASAAMIVRAVLQVFCIFAVLAAADYLYERWKFERSIRMSRDEIRQEFRESEGDPQVKARIKSIQRDTARRRMMQAVPKATVVITNPTHLAVALQYDRESMSAPTVTAKGAGYVAEAIKAMARRHGVPQVEDKPLARALFKLNVGSVIPRELYRAVAKVLAYIYKLRGAA